MATPSQNLDDQVSTRNVLCDSQKLLESYYYLLNVPGKSIRSILINIFQKWLHIPEEKLVIIRDIVNSLHTSSLMYSAYMLSVIHSRIDDIEDNSKQRRGVPGECPFHP